MVITHCQLHTLTFSNLGNSSNILITEAILPANTNNFSVSIDNQTIRTYANTSLTMALMHKNEINRGIIIKEAKLVITYAATSAPAAPTNVSATPTPNGCTLSWNASSGATQYEVYNGNTKLTTVSTTSATISGLNPLTNYTLCVKAINAAGTSGCANVLFTTTHNVKISGSSLVCSGSPQTFSVTNAPAGFTWGKSSNLGLSSTTNSTISVSTSGGGSSSAWVSINYGGTELVRYNTWVGPPQVYTISGELYPCIDSDGSYRLHTEPNTSPATSYQWRIEGDGDSYISSPNWGEYCNVHVGGTRPFKLYARVINSCGYTETYVTITPQMCRSGSSPAYPNPVDDILYVEVGSNTDVSAQRAIQVYDIRLYDGNGTIVRQTSNRGSGTARIDVSGLPNGNYYLHIYDGVNRTPDIHQIIVRH